MIKKLFFVALSIVIIYAWMSSCSNKIPIDEDESSDKEPETDDTSAKGASLSLSADGGEEYLNSIVFLGESTTYHLKEREVLKDGNKTKQVWAPKSGTLMLDASTANCRIVYPETGEELDLAQAIKRKKPRRMILTFGLNGAVSSYSKGPQYFKSNYKKLIDVIKQNSENCAIIIQSCFPVAENMDMSSFSVDVATLNKYIDQLNIWAAQLAESENIGYLNTAEILKDQKGALRDEFQNGDGYHLTRTAYLEIIYYIRTHCYWEITE